MTKMKTVVGNVNDAARRYRTDAAGIWAAISSGRTMTLTDGRVVKIVADRRDDDGRWIVEEVQERP